MAIIDLGFGEKLNSLFCFVDGTGVMLEDFSEAFETNETNSEDKSSTNTKYNYMFATLASMIVISYLMYNKQNDREKNPPQCN